MTFETPADSWYVWVGVVLVSLSVAGVVVSLPSEPPPDTAGATNAIDRAAASEYGTRVSYETDAEQSRIGTKQLALQNDGGRTHASVAFGSITPVDAARGETREAGLALLDGATLTAVLSKHDSSEPELRERFEGLRERVDRTGADWRETNGQVRVRSVQIAGELVVLVGT